MIFLGKLEVGAGLTRNNHTTATTFDIPVGAGSLYLESDTPAVLFAIGGGTGTGNDTFAVTAANGAPLYDGVSANVVQGPYKVPQLGLTDPTMSAPPKSRVRVGAFNPTGGAIVVRVFWE